MYSDRAATVIIKGLKLQMELGRLKQAKGLGQTTSSRMLEDAEFNDNQMWQCFLFNIRGCKVKDPYGRRAACTQPNVLSGFSPMKWYFKNNNSCTAVLESQKKSFYQTFLNAFLFLVYSLKIDQSPCERDQGQHWHGQ